MLASNGPASFFWPAASDIENLAMQDYIVPVPDPLSHGCYAGSGEIAHIEYCIDIRLISPPSIPVYIY